MSMYIKQKIAVCRELGFVRLALLPVAASMVLILLSLSKLTKVRVHIVQNSRLGHFTVYTALTYLGLLQENNKIMAKGINLYIVNYGISANVYLEKMWKRKIHLISGNLGWLLVDLFNRVPKNQVCVETFGNDRDGLINQYLPCLTFEAKEIDNGVNFLKNLGLEENQKFVCLHVRDSSYLQKSTYLGYSARHDWSHHDYRNSKIKTYVPAAEALADMGYVVFRMGAVVEEPLVSKHPRIIDYASNGMRSEFLDIFLGAHCTFCVSTGSGWDSVPQIFKRPSLYVNYLPIFSHDCVVRDLLIYPKILQDRVTKDTLRLTEIIDRDIQTEHATQGYADAEAEFRELNSKELVEAVTEMAARVEGTFIETPVQKQMQAKLKHIFSIHPKLQPTPNYYPVRAEFASCFLSNYPNFLD